MEHRPDLPLQQSVWMGLRGRCPGCGKGRLFEGFLRLSPSCRSCGLDLGSADSADGPAVFVILIVGFVITGSALLAEIAFSPPIWLHLMLWPPLVLILCLGALRPTKGVLVALQFHHRAEPGRIEGLD